MSQTVPATAVPGQVLSSTSSFLPGPGTHVYESQILASILGHPITSPAPKSGKPMISILSPCSSLPVVGSTVLCRVTRVQQRQLNLSILTVLPSTSSATDIPTTYSQSTTDELQYQATLRREDVRTHEKDKVIMNESYRVGDIVRATVISLGDERNYYVSTAGNEYGVVIASSEEGNAMLPTSWKEMKDVVTGKGEGRKVAKPS